MLADQCQADYPYVALKAYYLINNITIIYRKKKFFCYQIQLNLRYVSVVPNGDDHGTLLPSLRYSEHQVCLKSSRS